MSQPVYPTLDKIPKFPKFFHLHHEASVAVFISQDREIRKGAQRSKAESIFGKQELSRGMDRTYKAQ